MKNPFAQEDMPLIHAGLMRAGFHGDKIDFTVQAINMHERLDAMQFAACSIAGTAVCPACNRTSDEGHSATCRYAALLKEAV